MPRIVWPEAQPAFGLPAPVSTPCVACHAQLAELGGNRMDPESVGKGIVTWQEWTDGFSRPAISGRSHRSRVGWRPVATDATRRPEEVGDGAVLRSMRRLRILLVIVLLVVGVGAVTLALNGRSGGTTAANQFITVAAARRDVIDSAVADGSVSASRSYALFFGSAPVPMAGSSTSSSSGSGGSMAWHVKQVKVAVGDTVSTGQVLAIASTAELTTQLDTTRRQLRTAQLRVDAAQEAYDNIDSSKTDARRQARIQLLDAESQHDQIQQTVDDLRQTIRYATLKAPAAGLVTQADLQAGADAPSGTTITIAVQPLQVTADFPESDLAILHADQAATVTVKAVGATLNGTVSGIAPAASTSSGGGVVSYTVTVSLTNPPAALRAGMSAQVSVTTASATGVLAVPTAALQGTADAYTVIVIDAAGQPASRQVTVGLISSSYAQISAGLAEGERVVIGTASQRQTGLPGFPGAGGGRLNAGGGGGGAQPGGGAGGGAQPGGGSAQP
jgi:RND family efflux transporter MFP subunit